MSAFLAIYTGLRKVTDAAKGIMEAHADAKVRHMATELQGVILDLQARISEVQTQYQDVLDTKEDLKKQLATYDRWEQESARYTLSEMARGILAYRLSPDQSSGEATHWLCPNCYQQRQKSILQSVAVGSGQFECPRCKLSLLTYELA